MRGQIGLESPIAAAMEEILAVALLRETIGRMKAIFV